MDGDDRSTPAEPDDLGLSREAIAGGLPMKRARSVAYLIEQEARRQQDRMQGINATSLAAASTAGIANVDLEDVLDAEARRGDLPGDADEAYVEAFRSARRDADDPVAHWLELSADQWRSLVPDSLELRVLVFAVLAERLPIVRKKARDICRNFGVDDPGFAEAYERHVGKPLDSAFAVKRGLFRRHG